MKIEDYKDRLEMLYAEHDRITRSNARFMFIMNAISFMLMLLSAAAFTFVLAVLAYKALVRNDYPMPADYQQDTYTHGDGGS